MAVSDFSHGRIGNQYQLSEMLGSGSEATVYAGHEIIGPLHEPRAFKVFADNYAGVVDGREAAILKSLSGEPHILGVRDFKVTKITSPQEVGTRAVMVTDLAQKSLEDVVRNSKEEINPERAVRLVGHAAIGVGAAHRRGIIHRDLKPQNLLIFAGDELRVADFGIAREAPDTHNPTTTLFAGTYPYAALEHLLGRATKRSDIYALGVVAFLLLHEGRSLPFIIAGSDARNPHSWIQLHEDPGRTVPHLATQPDAVQQKLQKVMERVLHRDPRQRYGAALELKSALEAALANGLEAMRAARTVPVNAPVRFPERSTFVPPTHPERPPAPAPKMPRPVAPTQPVWPVPSNSERPRRQPPKALPPPDHRPPTPFRPPKPAAPPGDVLVAPNRDSARNSGRGRLFAPVLAFLAFFGGVEAIANFPLLERSAQMAGEHNPESYARIFNNQELFEGNQVLGDSNELLRALTVLDGIGRSSDNAIFKAAIKNENHKGLTEAAMAIPETVGAQLAGSLNQLDRYPSNITRQERSRILMYAAALELMNTQTASGHQEILAKLKNHAGNSAVIPGTKVEFAMLEYFKLGKHNAQTTKRYVQQLVRDKEYLMLQALTPELTKSAPDVLKTVIRSFDPKSATAEETDSMINVLVQLPSSQRDTVKGFMKKLADAGYLDSLVTLGLRMTPVDVSTTEKIFGIVDARERGGSRAQTLAIALSRARPQYVLKIREYVSTSRPNWWLDFASKPKISDADCQKFFESQVNVPTLDADFATNAAALAYAMKTDIHGLPYRLFP